MLVARSIVRPYGLALAADGTLFIAETDAGRVYRVSPTGARDVLPLQLDAPAGLALSSDGTLFVADGRRVVVVGPSGGQDAIDVPGSSGIDAVGVDGAGTVYATDPAAGRVFQIDPDGAVSELAVSGVTEPRGIDVTDDGTVSVIDGAALDVVRRTADGTQTTVDVTGLQDPRTLDIEGDEVLSALFTSWVGAPGYSDPNPLRRADLAGGAVTDIPVAGHDVTGVEAAPDGTAYLLVTGAGGGQPRSIVRRSADGETIQPVPLPEDPATPEVVAMSVDEGGRLFVAMSTGYGNGPFAIIEPSAPGGPKTWYRTPNDARVALGGMAAGDGKVFIVVSTLGDPSTTEFQTVSPDGTLGHVRTIPSGSFLGMDVDVGGNVFLLASSPVKAQSAPISVIAADGSVGTITYAGGQYPQAVSVGTDGTLYVADSQIGLIAFRDVGAVAGDEGVAAPPAEPVPGSASFTG